MDVLPKGLLENIKIDKCLNCRKRADFLKRIYEQQLYGEPSREEPFTQGSAHFELNSLKSPEYSLDRQTLL